MSSERRPEKDPCWLVWEVGDTGTFLRAVTTTPELADGYLKVLRNEEKIFGDPRTFHKERSQFNHLYGVSAIQKYKHLGRRD